MAKRYISAAILSIFFLISGCSKGWWAPHSVRSVSTSPFSRNTEKGDQSYFRHDDPDIAIGFYTQAIQSWSETDGRSSLADTYYKRGRAYYEKGQRSKCIDDLKVSANYGNADASKFLKEKFKIIYMTD